MKTYYRTLLLICFAASLFFSASAQVNETRKLRAFDKVVVSPMIELDLVEGDEESIEITGNFISPNDIITKNDGKTLRIYLRDAKIVYKDKHKKRDNYGWYKGAQVKATLTYKDLRKLQVRGEQTVELLSPIDRETFKLKLYGENKVFVSDLDTDKFKLTAFGESDVFIENGQIGLQLVYLYGESKFNAVRAASEVIKVRALGESSMDVKANQWLRVMAMGESEIYLEGDASVPRGLILGEAEISRGNMYSKKANRNYRSLD